MRAILSFLLILLLSVPPCEGARAYSTTSNYTRVSSALVTAAPLTMCCWFNLANTTAEHSLMGIFDVGGDVDYFMLLARGDVAGDPIAAVARRSSQGIANSTAAYTANTWSHACGVFTSTTSRTVYLNGANSATDTTSITPAGLDRTTVGMRDRATPTSMSGSIAEAAIWNVALDASEIAALAKGFSPRLIRPASLVFYAPLTRNVIDLKGNAITDTSSQSSLDHPRVYFPMGQTRRMPAWMLAWASPAFLK